MTTTYSRGPGQPLGVTALVGAEWKSPYLHQRTVGDEQMAEAIAQVPDQRTVHHEELQAVAWVALLIPTRNVIGVWRLLIKPRASFIA
jgi:hypothetical protein